MERTSTSTNRALQIRHKIRNARSVHRMCCAERELRTVERQRGKLRRQAATLNAAALKAVTLNAAALKAVKLEAAALEL